MEAAKKLADLKSKVARENPGNKNSEAKKNEILKKCEEEFYALIGKNVENSGQSEEEKEAPQGDEKKLERKVSEKQASDRAEILDNTGSRKDLEVKEEDKNPSAG